MPRVIVKQFGDPGEEICELAEAEHILNFVHQIVMIDGQKALCYEDVVKIVSQTKYMDQEYVEVFQIPAIAGG